MPITDRQLALGFAEFFKTQVDMHRNPDPRNLERCRYTPDVIRLKPGQRLFALGDLHGDFDVLVYSLFTAELINERGQWTGGDAVVVQLGDMFDGQRPTGPALQDKYSVPYGGEREIVNFLKNLHLEAVASGGMVITMLGNHDVYRLLTTYIVDGTPVMPDPFEYHLAEIALPPRYTVGMDVAYGSRVGSFMTRDNKSDFTGNQSLFDLRAPNEYGSEHNGFHRQLLASCATKLFLKCVYENSSSGVLCSHGEKNSQFLSSLKRLIISRLKTCDQRYNLDLIEILQDLNTNNDLLIVAINSLWSFFLRACRRHKVASYDYFGRLLVEFLDMISGNIGNDSFIWCYLNSQDPDILQNVCRENARSLLIFNLNPRQSLTLSAHSGPYSGGILRIGPTGWCRPHQQEGPFPVHANTAVMTDVTATRAFGNTRQHYLDEDGQQVRQPQIVRVSKPEDRDAPLQVETLTLAIDRDLEDKDFEDGSFWGQPSRHRDPALSSLTSNPTSLDLIPLDLPVDPRDYDSDA